MSHQFVEGFYSNNEPAWHGLGRVLPAGVWPGKQEAMVLAGHNFKVIEEPVYAKGRELTDHKALFTDKGFVLSVVNRTYNVIQNDVPYDLIEAVAKEGIKWHVGLTLEGGQCVVVGYLPEEWTAPGDNSVTFPFLSATWAHNGMCSLKLLRTMIRVVCANTKAAAEGEAMKTGLQVTIRHTKNWQDHVERARFTLMNLRQGFDEYKELATELANMVVSESQVKTFLEQFLPMPDNVSVQFSERVRDNVVDARAEVEEILRGPNTAPAHQRTGYGLWQSGLEYLQHTRKARTAYTRFGRSVLREDRAAENLHRLVRSIASPA